RQLLVPEVFPCLWCLPDLGEVVPLELDVADTSGIGDPGPDQLGPGRDYPDHEPAAPVVPDEIDRAIEALQLCREPVGVLVHRRPETGRTVAVEPGKRQRDGIGVVELSHEAVPDGRGFWHSVDEDGGHGSHTGTAEARAGQPRPPAADHRQLALSWPWCAIMPGVPLTPDELLTTTRSVRKRLGLTRPVPPDLVKECLEIA